MSSNLIISTKFLNPYRLYAIRGATLLHPTYEPKQEGRILRPVFFEMQSEFKSKSYHVNT